MKVIDLVAICYEINRASCESLGDYSQPPWDEAPQWPRDRAIRGVLFHQANPHAGPEASHEAWLTEKRAAGWKWDQ